jgi:hypothetical protein
MQCINAAVSSGSKRTCSQTRAAYAAAAALTSSSASSLPASAAAPPLSISSDAVTDPAKRQRRTDGRTNDERKAHAASEDERMEADDVKEERKSVARDHADSDTGGVAAAALSSLPSNTGDRAAQSTAVPQEHSNVASPITRLDQDSLSIMLSMLSSNDFLSAIRVNKQCYAARLKESAWPTLQLDSFIQSLRDDDYDNPARRRLRLRIPTNDSADTNESSVARVSAVFGSPSSNSSAWHFVTDVQCTTRTKDG